MSPHTAHRFSLCRRLIIRPAGLCVAAWIFASAPAAATQSSDTPSINYTGVMVPDGDNNVTLRDIKIVYPDSSFSLTIGKLVLGRVVTDSSRFTAGTVQLLESRLSDGRETYIIPQMELADISTPLLTPADLNLASAPGRLPPIAAWALNINFKSAVIPSVDVMAQNMPSAAKFSSVDLAGVESGKIARLSILSYQGSSQSPTQESTATGTRTGRIDLTGFDVRLLASWFDDDLAKKTAVGRRNFIETLVVDKINTPDGYLGEARISNLELAPPDMPPSEILTLLKQAGDTAPQANPQITKLTYDRFRLGTLELRNLKPVHHGLKDIHVGLLRVENLTPADMSELRLNDIKFFHKQYDQVNIGSLSVRGVQFINLSGFFHQIGNYISSHKLAQSAQNLFWKLLAGQSLPRMTFKSFAVTDIKAPKAQKGPVDVGSLGIDAENWQGFLPAYVKMYVGGVNIPIDELNNSEEAQALKDINFRNALADFSIEMNFDEKNSTMKYIFIFNIKDFAQCAVSVVLSDVSKFIYTDPFSNYPLSASVKLSEASINIKDQKGYKNMFDRMAKNKQIDIKSLVDSMMSKSGKLLPAIGKANATKITNAVRDFLITPGSLTIRMKWEQPFPMISLGLIAAGALSPKELRKSLIVEVENK